jgi:alpha-1,3-rhamnosyltransferase
MDQDYPNIELIIIDDGSTDGTMSVLEGMAEKCRDRFVRFELRSRQNKGQCATLNEALEWASGEFFAQMDSDDVLMSNKVSFQVEQFRREPDIVGMFSGTLAIDEHGAEIFRLTHPQKYYDFEDFIMHRHTFHTIGQLLRLDSVRNAGGYPEGCLIGDWYMWMAITKNGSKIKSSHEILAKYRYHQSNASKNKLAMTESRMNVLEYFKDHAHYPDAMAMVSIWGSTYFTYHSKHKAIGYLLDAVKWSRSTLVNPSFYKAILGICTPEWLAKHSKFYVSRFHGLDKIE